MPGAVHLVMTMPGLGARRKSSMGFGAGYAMAPETRSATPAARDLASIILFLVRILVA